MSEVWSLKYRPKNMGQLLGQGLPKRIIHGALDAPEFPAAFLVSGPYGTGKTSISRIIGRVLTCENLTPQKEACGTCWNCTLDLGKGESPNYHEQDAASAGGVADVEKLLADSRLAPVGSPRRVLCLDEAQMLSKEAQNKLLKSLEEGIGKTCILLVTTHPEKLIPTIRSRCIHLNITSVETKIVLAFLKDIVTKEGKSYEDAALELIVHERRGHIRDTLNLAYQISLYGSITLEAVKQHLNLHLEDHAAQLLLHVGESWDATIQKAEELFQEIAPEDIWNAVCCAIGQAFLCVGQPSYHNSPDIKRISEQHGMRLGTVAEWTLGEGSRLRVKAIADLLVVLRILRDKLGITDVVRETHMRRSGVPKSVQIAAGVRRDQVLTEETVAATLGFEIFDKPVNGDGRVEGG